MSTYRSNNNGGCLGYLILFGIIGLFGLISHCKEHSQGHMIEEARKSRSIYKYADYLKEHPKGRYVKEAGDFVIDYYSEKVRENNMYSWEDAIEDMEREKRYFANTGMETRMDSLINARVDVAYNSIKAKDSDEAWSDYLKCMPEQYWRDAKEQKESVNQRKWGSESAAWKTASAENTEKAYQKYLDMYPKGAHVSTANKRIIDRQVDNIFAGSHGTLPSMNQSSYGGTSSRVSVSNDTQYTLTLLYSGASSKRIILSPHSSQTFTLANGNYRIAASVNTSGVTPYAGSESLTGGSYNASYYISTTKTGQYNSYSPYTTRPKIKF